MDSYAFSAGDKLFFLPDKTVIMLAGNGMVEPAILIRLDENLNIHFEFEKFKTISVTTYEDLLLRKGLFKTQEELLSKLK